MAGRWTFAKLLAVCALALAAMVVATRWRSLLPHGRETVAAPVAAAQDREGARFRLCQHRFYPDCVIDGDTIRYKGEKIRIADINAPEVSEPQCDHELDLGEAATDRLLALLNAGRFSLRPLPDRDADVYGRKLRVIERGGQSLGLVLVREGLAEKWKGYRGDWCS